MDTNLKIVMVTALTGEEGGRGLYKDLHQEITSEGRHNFVMIGNLEELKGLLKYSRPDSKYLFIFAPEAEASAHAKAAKEEIGKFLGSDETRIRSFGEIVKAGFPVGVEKVWRNVLTQEGAISPQKERE